MEVFQGLIKALTKPLIGLDRLRRAHFAFISFRATRCARVLATNLPTEIWHKDWHIPTAVALEHEIIVLTKYILVAVILGNRNQTFDSSMILKN